MNYPGKLGVHNIPATVKDYARNVAVTVKVNYLGREWPHGRVVLGLGDETAVLTPNHARRLLDMLERAITNAEDRR